MEQVEIPQFCSFQYEKNQYFCIGLSNDDKPVILSGAKQSAIKWRATLQDSKASFSFLINKKPVYLACNNKNICLAKDPFFFDYTTVDISGAQYTLLGVEHRVVMTYIITPETQETDREGTDPVSTNKIIHFLEWLAKQAVIFLASNLAIKFMKKLGLLIKDLLSKAVIKMFRSGQSVGEVAETTEVIQVAGAAQEAQAGVQQAAYQAAQMASKRAAQAAAERQAAEIAAKQAAETAAKEAAETAAKEAAEIVAKQAAERAAVAAGEEAVAVAAEGSAWAEVAEVGEVLLLCLL